MNAGLNHATGLYFKVVDSDDWVDEASYRQILDALHNLCSAGCMLDMMISNFVYEKKGQSTSLRPVTIISFRRDSCSAGKRQGILKSENIF